MEFHFRRHFRLRLKMKNAFRSASIVYIRKRSWSWYWTLGLVLILKLRYWSWSWSWKKVLITSVVWLLPGGKLRLMWYWPLLTREPAHLQSKLNRVGPIHVVFHSMIIILKVASFARKHAYDGNQQWEQNALLAFRPIGSNCGDGGDHYSDTVEPLTSVPGLALRCDSCAARAPSGNHLPIKSATAGVFACEYFIDAHLVAPRWIVYLGASL